MPNFNSDNLGTWFYFSEDDPDVGGVCLRELSSDEFQRIEQMTIQHRRKFKRGVAFDDPKVDEKLASRLRWDWCITDWKEVQLDGQLLECSTDNKVKMMKVTDFVKFVVDSLENLIDANKSLEEVRLKNSSSSSNGNSESQLAMPA